jgi:hypothetical protein
MDVKTVRNRSFCAAGIVESGRAAKAIPQINQTDKTAAKTAVLSVKKVSGIVKDHNP